MSRRVERLVVETVIGPLREDWRAVLGAAQQARDGGDARKALALVEGFHESLCATRVLDPACGTGNFLHVSQELMEKLEGEVLDAASELGSVETLGGFARHAVGPQQFLGMETNRRAVAIADLVFPYSSIGAGLAAAKSANIPVVTWGGGLGASVAATNGSGAPIAQPVIDKMVADFGG